MNWFPPSLFFPKDIRLLTFETPAYDELQRIKLVNYIKIPYFTSKKKIGEISKILIVSNNFFASPQMLNNCQQLFFCLPAFKYN